MPIFARRPVVIEARQYIGSNGFDLFRWVEGNEVKEDPMGAFIAITTTTQSLRVEKWDWVIKGATGEYSVSKPDVFAVEFQRV